MALLLLLTVDPCARPTEHGSWPSSDRDSTAPGPARLTPCLTSETAEASAAVAGAVAVPCNARDVRAAQPLSGGIL